jgi:hypothetical protein
MRHTRKDVSGLPKNKLPPTPDQDLLLYHWSPTRNRNSINHRGLLTHRRTLQGEWKPPYICFSEDPILGWTLSGEMWQEIKSWDLWMTNCNAQTSFDHYEIITDTFVDTGRYYVKEYRIYTRVYKRDLIYLGTRTQ